MSHMHPFQCLCFQDIFPKPPTPFNYLRKMLPSMLSLEPEKQDLVRLHSLFHSLICQYDKSLSLSNLYLEQFLSLLYPHLPSPPLPTFRVLSGPIQETSGLSGLLARLLFPIHPLYCTRQLSKSQTGNVFLLKPIQWPPLPTRQSSSFLILL